MPQENEIYTFMKSNGLTQLDENAFLNKYSTPEKAKEIHSFMQQNDLTKLDESTFYDKYLKKKQSPQPPLPVGTQRFAIGGESTPQLPLTSQSKLVKEPKLNPFTATQEELKKEYGENYNRDKQIVRQKNYAQGLQKVSKNIETLMPQYDFNKSEVDKLDAQLAQVKDDPQAFNQLLPLRNQKAQQLISLADNLKSEATKAEIYQKGLSAVQLNRELNENTFGNNAQAAFNTLGIMATTMLPAMDRGRQLIQSKVDALVTGMDAETEKLYTEAMSKANQKDWQGLTDVAKTLYDKNQILEGGFSQQSGWDKIKEGDYKGAGSQLAKELIQTLPVTLGIGVTMANPLLGAAFIGGGTAGAELQDMDLNNPNMSEQAKIANAFVKGGSEYLTEKVFGTFNYLGKIAGNKTSPAAKKYVLGSLKEAFEQTAKKMGIAADVIEETSTEMLNQTVSNYADWASGKTNDLDFSKGMGQTFTTALTTALTLSGAGRAAKYGIKKIDDLRNKAKDLKAEAENANAKPKIVDALKEAVLNTNEEIGNEAQAAKAKYDAMPPEQQLKVDDLVEEKDKTEALLKDPEIPQILAEPTEKKLQEIQSNIDEEYKSVDEKTIPTEEQKLETIISETSKEITQEITTEPTPTEDNGVGNAGVEPVSVEEKKKNQELDAKKINKEAGIDFYVARQSINAKGDKYILSQVNENGNTNTFLIEDANGNEIGKAQLSADGSYLENIRIDEKHRRKGIASKVYDFIEQRKGINLEPSPNKQSKEAKLLWDKRNLQKSVSNKVNGGLLAKALGEEMSKAFADFKNKRQVLLELENKYFEQKGLSKEDFSKLNETEKAEIIKDAINWKNNNPKLIKEVEQNIEQSTQPKSEISSTPKEKDQVILPPIREGGEPRTMVFNDGNWQQKVGKEYTNVGKTQQQEAQEQFTINNKENAVNQRKIAESDKSEHQNRNEGGKTAETSNRNSNVESGEKQKEQEKVETKSEISSKPKPENVKAIENAVKSKSEVIKKDALKEAANPKDVEKIVNNLETIKKRFAEYAEKTGKVVFSEECKWG